MSKKVSMVLGLLLGLVLLVFGFNKFFNFMPMPPMEGPPGDFMAALNNTGYMFPLIALTEVAAGALLLVNKFKGLALILISIISVNIVLFHLVLAPAGIALAAVVAILNIILIYANWKKFRTLF